MVKVQLKKILPLALFCLYITSCTSMGGGTLNGKTVSKKDYGSPETHTLLFGYLRVKRSYSDFAARDIETFVQVNPEKEAMILMPRYFRSPAFCIVPVEPGTKLRLAYAYYEITGYQSTTIYSLYSTLNDPEELTLCYTAKKPGLQYVGSINREEGAYIKEKTSYELAALQDMQAYFKGTAWEAVINARVKELEE